MIISTGEAIVIAKQGMPEEYKKGRKEQEYLSKVFDYKGVRVQGGFDEECLRESIKAFRESLSSDTHKAPEKADNNDDRGNSIPNSQTIYKPVETPQETIIEQPVDDVQCDDEDAENNPEVDVMTDFKGYPKELTSVSGWMINCNKKPIYHRLLEEHITKGQKPQYEELSADKNVYLQKSWEKGELCMSFEDAVRYVHLFQEAYADQPETAKLFGLCELCLKWEDMISFELDDKETNNAYGQQEFFDHCCKKGYHVSKSYSGNAHYCMFRPEIMKRFGVFKWQDGKKEGDFEIEYGKGQWNETGNLYSCGCIIPSDDETALEFIQARIDRRIKRKGDESQISAAMESTEDVGIAASDPELSIEKSASSVIIPKDMITGAKDENKVKSFVSNPPASCKAQVLNLKESGQDLSSLMHGMFKDCIKAGCNLNTTKAIFFKTALHSVYKGRSDYSAKINPHKLEQSYRSAYAEVEKEKSIISAPVKMKPTEEEFSDEELQEAKQIYESGRALEYMVESCQEEHVGDRIPQKAHILSYASSKVLNGNGIHVTTMGDGASGKSDEADKVKKRLPISAILPPGNFSDMALFYMDLHKGTIIHIDDQTMSGVQEEILRARTSNFWDIYEHRTVKSDRTGAQNLSIPPACPQWLTTVTDNTNEQTQSRVLVLRVDESVEQRSAVKDLMCDNFINPPDDFEDLHSARISRAIWSFMQDETVLIPFARRIKYDLNDETANRTFKMFGTLIQCAALMRAAIRQRDEKNRILAEEDDFYTAQEIMNESLGTKKINISKTQLELVKYLFNTETQLRKSFPADDPEQHGHRTAEISERNIHRFYNDEKAETQVTYQTIVNLIHGRKRDNGTRDIGLDVVPGIRLYQRVIDGTKVNEVELDETVYAKNKQNIESGIGLFELLPDDVKPKHQKPGNTQSKLSG